MRLFIINRVLLLALLLPLSSCKAQITSESFDHAKAATLSPERRAQMDVAFFNDFVVRDMPGGMWQSGTSHPRGARIHALAEEGFEVAWLAEQFYNFNRIGYRDTQNGQHYWNRIKELADGGDASAQCFIWFSAEELQLYGFFKPPQTDVENRAYYLKLAVAQGQPECTGSWGAYPDKDQKKHAENNLYAAKKGCVSCQSRVRSFYLNGSGLPKDMSKAWCWALEAERNNDSLSYVGDRQIVHRAIMQTKPNDMGRPEDLIQYRPGSNCTESITVPATAELKEGE